MNHVLSTIGLAVGFGQRRLIHGLDLMLRSGELVSIRGRNGSGKSTLLRTLVGAMRPVEGTIRIAGRNLSALSADQRALLVAAVFSGRSTSGQVTVLEALVMARFARTGWAGRLSTSDHAALSNAARTAGISGWENRTLGTLSDGEYQRVMIARAIQLALSAMVHMCHDTVCLPRKSHAYGQAKPAECPSKRKPCPGLMKT